MHGRSQAHRWKGRSGFGISCVRDAELQVYVSVAKRKIVEALNLPAEYKALLTTYDRAALLHAVPLWRVSLKHMAHLLKHYRGRLPQHHCWPPADWLAHADRHDPSIFAFALLT